MSERPHIGVTTYLDFIRWSDWVETPCFFTPVTYCKAVFAAGGLPVLIPSMAEYEEHLPGLLHKLDGLVLIGGADIEPALYGQIPHHKTYNWNEERDLLEVSIMKLGLDEDMPLLGICRGMQLLNVVKGGDLIQHVPDKEQVTLQHENKLGVFAEHAVLTEEGTLLREIYGNKSQVFSSHHQALQNLGQGLVVSAVDTDGTIEGIEDPSKRFVVGVQWHPEEDINSQLPLFKQLISKAIQYRMERQNE